MPENTQPAIKRAAPEGKVPIAAGGAVSAFVPQDFDSAWRLAQAFATQGGDMIPEGFRDSPGAVFLAMSKGAELGLAPLSALQSIASINGRATVWGDALPGLIQRAGHWLEERIEGEGDDMVAHCKLVRADGRTCERTFSVDDAKRAGLWQTQARVKRRSRNGGEYEKDNDSPWYRYPKRMLQMRARGFAVRDGAADVMMGLSMAEEVRDHQGPEHAKDITPAQPEKPSLQQRIEEEQRRREAERAAAEAEATTAEPETDTEQEPKMDANPESDDDEGEVDTEQEPDPGERSEPDTEPEPDTDEGDDGWTPDPERGLPMDPAWDEGSAAFKRNIAYADNPYRGEPGDSWAAGWKGAEKAFAKDEEETA